MSLGRTFSQVCTSKRTGEQLDEERHEVCVTEVIIEVVRSNPQDMPVQERFLERMVEESVDNHVRWSLKDELFFQSVQVFKSRPNFLSEPLSRLQFQ